MENEIATFGGKNGEAASVGNTEAEDLTHAFLMRLGDRVRGARSRKNISRKVLSERSGVSLRYLAQLETGSGNISIILLRRVADA
ncbi:MAG: helix-turn-helix domain-containing protein, partial [Sneathiella sp.]